MANMHLVTGYAGKEHITSDDQAAFHVNALFGNGQYVLNVGNKLAASVVTNNQIRILDGEIIMQGRYVRIDGGAYVDLNIDSGSQGYMRNDLIVARYTKNSATAVEEVNLVVIKGTPAAINPVDPEHTEGDILNDHVMKADMPLYRVPLDGINIQELVPLFTVNTNNIPAIVEGKQDKTNTLATETALEDVDSIPFFDASASAHRKVLWSRIKAVLGNVFAAKEHSHSLVSLGAAAASHNHDASAINSGTLSVVRGGTGVNSIAGLAAALGACRVATGSYTGTGGYGAANPNTLTFDFEPKLVVISPTTASSHSGNTYYLVFVRGSIRPENTFTVTWQNTSVSWYVSSSGQYQASEQRNHSGEVYHYVAFG